LLKYIKSTERFTPTAFWDSRQWTNGYGTKALSPTGDRNDPGPRETVDESTAMSRMTAFLQNAVSTVITFGKKNGYNWNQGQVDALTSFSYNAGVGAINRLTDKGTRSNEEIAAKILEYNKAANNKTGELEVSKGLINRRQEELAMFQQARDGGIFDGPKSGYPMTLHGTEAVIPLKNGSVPVAMSMEGFVEGLASLLPNVPVKNGSVPVNMNAESLSKLMPAMPVKDGAVPVTIKSDTLANLMPIPDMDKENTAELAQDFKENIGGQLKQLVSEITTQLQGRTPENNNQELVQLMQDFVRGQRQMISTSDRLLQAAQN